MAQFREHDSSSTAYTCRREHRFSHTIPTRHSVDSRIRARTFLTALYATCIMYKYFFVDWYLWFFAVVGCDLTFR